VGHEREENKELRSNGLANIHFLALAAPAAIDVQCIYCCVQHQNVVTGMPERQSV
jgi:hypothetical protein